MATAREAAAGRIGRLRIGCAFGSLDQRFGARLAAFSRECPSIALEVRTVSGADAIEGLLRETIDIALTPALLPQEADAWGISQQPFARERVVLIASQSHFPKTQRLALADVRERRLLLPARHFDGPLHDAIRQAFREAPLSTTNVQEVVDAPSLIGLASAGVGIGVGPACWHLFATPDTLFLSATPETFVEYAFQFRIDVGNPTLRTFVDFLRED
jgi:DNA-binding transcriptional LysR family regulator